MNNQTDAVNQADVVDIILPGSFAQTGWSPVAGSETAALLEHLRIPLKEDKDKVVSEAVAVLSQCLPPAKGVGRNTGLVIGYVQSGKTTSFTTVAALAKDNSFRLIIVLSGITRNLFEQSRDRLSDDLRLSSRVDRKWHLLDNPPNRPEILQQIRLAIDWDDDAPGAPKQTVLIVVMKNRTHLDNLIQLLSSLDLQGKPALVIDDEADQASLNNLVVRGQESPTYRRILQIRDLLPLHTFLQYTATPQAPLLINLIDALSPDFAALLSPGVAYTGGYTFFESNFDLVRAIPFADIPSKDNHVTEPPDSLLEAMRIFFVGIACGLKKDGGAGNRSMMVHPSKVTVRHDVYADWVSLIKGYWERTLSLSDDDQDRHDLLEDFRVAHSDLTRTVDNLPSFEELVPFLRKAIKYTIITVVNSAHGKTPLPDWKQVYSHIVVGGDVLNRGYTIEGLTVTYMPRGKGVGNADTLQQRARWFGYKADYLGFCRVYLDTESMEIYENYVEHEEKIRHQLREHQAKGKSLREWRRSFLLSLDVRPTRRDVIDIDFIRGSYSDTWYSPKQPHASVSALTTNRSLVARLTDALSFQLDPLYPGQHHKIARGVHLDWIYREFLTEYQVFYIKDIGLTGILIQIGRYLEDNPDAQCSVYLMSGGHERKRTLNQQDEIPQLFEGRNSTYAGDSFVRASSGFTLQLHKLRLERPDKTIVADDVPEIALWIPKEMEAGWIVQDQGGN